MRVEEQIVGLLTHRSAHIDHKLADSGVKLIFPSTKPARLARPGFRSECALVLRSSPTLAGMTVRCRIRGEVTEGGRRMPEALRPAHA